MAVFAAHFVVAALFTLGWKPRLTSILLWLATVCMHGRQECFHDGSDKYFRNLLLWCCFMDLSGKAQPRGQAQLSIGTVGYVLQVCLMYAGVIALRMRGGSTWFNGTAVGYALGASFATKPPANTLIANPALCEYLSYGGLVGEAVIPVLILLSSNRTPWLRLAAVANVAAVHAGILFMFYLPQWSILATIATAFLLPSVFLDWLEHTVAAMQVLLGAAEPSSSTSSTATTATTTAAARMVGQKDKSPAPPSYADALTHGLRQRRAHDGGDNGSGNAHADNASTKTSNTTTSDSQGGGVEGSKALAGARWVGHVLGVLLLCYMCHEWLATDAGVITSFDHGDIGQGLRFYQGWVMFANPTGYSKWYTVSAQLPVHTDSASPPQQHAAGKGAAATPEYAMVHVDVLASLQQGRLVLAAGDEELDARREQIPACTSCLYPSWRYERYLHKAQERRGRHLERKAVWPLTRHWCHMLQDIASSQMHAGTLVTLNGTRVDHVYWGDVGIRTVVTLYGVSPPSAARPSFQRVLKGRDIDVTIKCFNWPEFDQPA